MNKNFEMSCVVSILYGTTDGTIVYGTQRKSVISRCNYVKKSRINVNLTYNNQTCNIKNAFSLEPKPNLI